MNSFTECFLCKHSQDLKPLDEDEFQVFCVEAAYRQTDVYSIRPLGSCSGFSSVFEKEEEKTHD